MLYAYAYALPRQRSRRQAPQPGRRHGVPRRSGSGRLRLCSMASHSSGSSSRSGWIAAASGLCSGSAAAVVGQPLDTLRVRLQAGRQGYTGVAQCLRGTVRTAGVSGLFAGSAPQVVCLALMQSLTFSVFGSALRWAEHVHPSAAVKSPSTSSVQQLWRQASSTNLVVAGVLSGFPLSLVQTPMDRLKCLLQTHAGGGAAAGEGSGAGGHAGRNVRGWCRALARVSLAHGLYSGFQVTLMRSLVAGAVFFVTYEQSRHAAGALAGLDPLTSRFSAGGVAGCATWLAVCPLDAIKSYQQALPEHTPREGRTWQVAVGQLRATHGSGWGWCGLGPVLLRGFVVNGVTMFLFTEVESRLFARFGP
jgi:solute carrier family 25 carnitine/acylcarnitine transporter 20/29